MNKRELTEGESRILRIIQEEYGPQNTAREVFFTDADEAALFIEARDGTKVMMVDLTNLAAWLQDGIIKSEDDLRTNWLSVPRS